MSEVIKLAKIFACSQSQKLGEAIAKAYGIPLGQEALAFF